MKKTISTSTLTYAVGCFGESPRRKSKHLTSTLTWFFLACLFLTLTSTLTYASTIGKITAVEGNVDIMKPGQERVVPVRLLEPVSEGDIVRTKSSGKAEITFDDESIIRIAPNSRLQITEYLMEGSKRKSGIMNLFRGKIRAVVSKSRKIIGIAFGEGERFEVRTPTAVAGVKGTDFFVTYALGITGVMVADGKIDVFNPAIPGQVVLVTTGNATTIAENQPPQTPRPVSDVEKIRHLRDTDPAEKPKDKDDEDETMVATATAEGVFGYEAPDEGTSLTASGGFADAEPDALPVTETHPELLADFTAPTISIVSKSAFPATITADTADIIINLSSNEPVTYSYSLDGGASWTETDSSLTLQLSEGSYTLDIMATDTAGNTSFTSLPFDLSRYSLSGSASDTNNNLFNSFVIGGEVVGVSGQNWGGWNITMSGFYVGVPDPFVLVAGGTSTDTPISNPNNGGYWLDIMTGSASGGGFSGASSFKYLSYDRLGTGTGTFTGLYNADNTWSATDSGTYTETPLAWSGRIDYDSNDSGLYYSNVDGIWSAGDTYNLGNNLVGGTQSPWSGTTSLTLMGLYSSGTTAPYLWDAPIYSYNVNDSTNTTYDGGAFWGLTGGVWKSDRTIDARVYSLYIDPSGNAGILRGSLTGAYYPELSMFSADGTWTPTVLATGFVDPTILGSLTYFPDLTWLTFGLSGTGSFTAGGTISEGQTQGLKYSMPGTLPGEGWGVWQALTAGGYSGNTSDTWKFSFNDIFLGNIVGAQTDGYLWSNNQLAGTTYAYGADITTTPMTWISVGETIGTFDPNTTTWQAVQTGAWLETTKFLDMANPTSANYNPTALTALNIPFAEVGRTNLSGSNGIDMNATMNNVIFFAYNTGAAPKIWATNEVSGSYTCSACSLAPINLSGTEGLSATMAIQQWDTVNNKWTATVNGGGTYTGTGTMNGSTVQMNGAAAGGIDTQGPGTFSGTAAGVAQ